MVYIENARVILPDRMLADGAILVQGDTLVAADSRQSLPCPPRARRLDARGCTVGPGFVDIHAHGGGGIAFYDDPAGAAQYHLCRGTTTVLAALYHTLDQATLLQAMDRIREAMTPGGSLQGIYMEGPYLNPKYGASQHANRWLDTPDPAAYLPLIEKGRTLVRLWAVAPERAGVAEFMARVKKADPDARFAVAHSEATPRQLAALKPLGLNQLTHCMNATGQPSQWLGTRGAGPDEACLLDGDMYAELISDSGGVHVCPPLQRLILQVKGQHRVILISDHSARAAETAVPPALRQMTDLSFDAQGNLGGSRLCMAMAVRNVLRHTQCTPVQAFLMAATNPARAVGLDHRLGSIQPGKRADLVFLNEEYYVNQVMLAGTLLKEETLC